MQICSFLSRRTDMTSATVRLDISELERLSGMTPSRIAELAKISRTTVYKLRNNENIKRETAAKIFGGILSSRLLTLGQREVIVNFGIKIGIHSGSRYRSISSISEELKDYCSDTIKFLKKKRSKSSIIEVLNEWEDLQSTVKKCIEETHSLLNELEERPAKK